MSDRIYKHKIGDTNVNLVQVVAFYIENNSLVVETTGRTLIFNAPDDVDNLSSALSDLEAAFDAAQIELTPVIPEVPNDDPQEEPGDDSEPNDDPQEEPGDDSETED